MSSANPLNLDQRTLFVILSSFNKPHYSVVHQSHQSKCYTHPHCEPESYGEPPHLPLNCPVLWRKQNLNWSENDV